jgi:hypothetical protein
VDARQVPHIARAWCQGTSEEHSVRVERTPVSPHPNCKKHLKEVPRSTQNITCQHEYLRLGLTPNDVLRNIEGIFKEHSTNIRQTCREYAGNVQGTCREH